MTWFLICSVLVFFCIAIIATVVAKFMLDDVINENHVLNLIVGDLANVKKGTEARYSIECRVDAQRSVFRHAMLTFFVGGSIAVILWTLVYNGYILLHPMLGSVYTAIRSL